MIAESTIDELIAQGAQVLANRAAQRIAYEAQERKEIAEKWEPHINVVHRTLPEWMHPHLTVPDGEPEFYNGSYESYVYRPMTLELPGLAPIDLYAGREKVRYAVPEVRWEQDEETGRWEPHYRWSRWALPWHAFDDLESNLAVAVAEARRQAQIYAEECAKIDERNRQEPAQPVAAQPRALDQAKQQMAHAERMDGEYASPALDWVRTYAAIAQAEALTRIADALSSRTAINTDGPDW